MINISSSSIKAAVAGGISFYEALKAEIRKRPPKRYVVCAECKLTKQIAKGDICARCQEKLRCEKERRKQ